MKKKWIITAAVIAGFCLAAGGYKYYSHSKSGKEDAPVAAVAKKNNILNVNGLVIFYADNITESMKRTMDETSRRREKQMAYNVEHGIVPKTIVKSVRDVLEISSDVNDAPKKKDGVKMTEKERRKEIERLEQAMAKAAKMLEFEYAAALRDRLIELRGESKKK